MSSSVNSQHPQVSLNYLYQQSNLTSCATPAPTTGFTYLNDANKAFDDVVFELLKVDPDDIAVKIF